MSCYSASVLPSRVIAALNVFNCMPTSPPDGSSYMAGMLQYPCGGKVHSAMLFPAIVAFAFYSVAVPGIALWFLRSKVGVWWSRGSAVFACLSRLKMLYCDSSEMDSFPAAQPRQVRHGALLQGHRS